jgi:hypothetical protein
MCDILLVIASFITIKRQREIVTNEITWLVIMGPVLMKPHLAYIFVDQVNN